MVKTTISFDGGEAFSHRESTGGEVFPYAYNNYNYFAYENNEIFYQMAPYYYLPYYQEILRPQIRIHDGFLPQFHDVARGLVPRKFLQRVADKLTDIVIPSSIDFSANCTDDYARASAIDKSVNIYKKFRQAKRLAAVGGDSLITVNYNPRLGTKFNLSSYRKDQFFADIDGNGEVEHAMIWVDGRTDTVPDSGAKVQYALFEERYYDKDRKPFAVYKVYVKHGTIRSQNREQNIQPTTFDKLPDNIKNWVRNNYGATQLSVPIPIQSQTLDCWLICNTDGHPVYPTLKFGEPIGSILFNESLVYDILGMTSNVELYLGKGKVMLPSSMIDPNGTNRGGRMNGIEYQYYEGGNIEQNKPIPIQHDIRAANLREMRDMLLEDTATALSVSPTTIAQFLASASHSSSRTILEIETSNQATSDYIERQRALDKPTFDDILTNLSRKIGGGKLSLLLNKSQQATFETNAAVYMQMWDGGIISAEDFVNELYPNLNFEQKQKRITYMIEQRNQAILMAQANQNKII